MITNSDMEESQLIEYAFTPFGCVWKAFSEDWQEVKKNNSAEYIANCKYFLVNIKSKIFNGLSESKIELEIVKGINGYVNNNIKPEWLTI